MTRRDRIEARAKLLTEPARSRVRGAVEAVAVGRLDAAARAVADLARDVPGLRGVAIELASEVAELRLCGAVSLDGPRWSGAPGGLGLWGNWKVEVFPEETVAGLSLAERQGGFDLAWRPESDEARHSSDMGQAVGVLTRELEAWLGRHVRLIEVFA